MNSPPPDAWLVCVSAMPKVNTLPFEHAMQILSAATSSANRLTFEWRMMDSPEPGTIALALIDPTASKLPSDGVRWASSHEQSQRVTLPLQPSHALFNTLGSQIELEQLVLTNGYQPPKGVDVYGHIQTPSPDSALVRTRRRYKLIRTPLPQLQLFMWGIDPNPASCPPVPAGWDREAVRNYPLPVPPKGTITPYQNRGPLPQAVPPAAVPVPQQHQQPQQSIPPAAAPAPHMKLNNPVLARHPAVAAPPSLPPVQIQQRVQPARASVARPQPPAYTQRLPATVPGSEEYEQVSDALDLSARALTAARYRLQHENIAQLFDAWPVKDLLQSYVTQGEKEAPKEGEEDKEVPPPVATLEDEKVKLRATLEQLKSEITEQERLLKERKATKPVS